MKQEDTWELRFLSFHISARDQGNEPYERSYVSEIGRILLIDSCPSSALLDPTFANEDLHPGDPISFSGGEMDFRNYADRL
jgi:hypothetical protein